MREAGGMCAGWFEKTGVWVGVYKGRFEKTGVFGKQVADKSRR
jgi:hypothetical protein